jgi:hypothetical protein
VRIPRYLFHVKRGQVTILCQNGIELGGHEEAEAEGKRRLQEILTESVPGETWQTGGRSLSRRRNGARCSNCRSRVARAIGGRPRPIVRFGLVDPTDFSRDKNSSPPIDWCRWHVRHTPKKNGRRSGGRGAQISAQCWCGSAELINLTTIVGPALFPIGEQEGGWPLCSGPAIRNCIMRSTILPNLA